MSTVVSLKKALIKTLFNALRERDEAQLVERRAVSSKVLGSTPGAVTKSYIAG
jgi:hypothetical protein